MAAKKNQKSSGEPATDQLELTYRLAELPTTQHRAGLVGMVMLVKYINAQGTPESDATIKNLTAYGATFSFTSLGLQHLFDCAFSTTMGEVSSEKPFKNRNKDEIPPLRIEVDDAVDKKGKPVKRTRYFYPKAIPRGAFLSDCDPSGRDGVWIKLWRDMLWSIPRGVPATRRPFEDRGDKKVVNDGLEMYASLKTSRDKSVELASTYLLGAQANTADNVTFSDSADRQLLLHFWPFATELFVPSILTRDGKSEFDGYVFAFPDVINLEAYCEDYFDFLRARSTEKAAFLPRSAVVDLPGEAGLRTMSWMTSLLEKRTQQGKQVSISDLVMAVDVLHARKDGNNVRILSHSRVDPRFAGEYERISRKQLWSHVFRRQLLVNLLAERPWYYDFARLLATLPTELTFQDGAFQHDARAMFEEKKQMTDSESVLPALLYRVATNYLSGILQSKHDLSWNDETKQDPQKYNEKKEKLAREALLAMRSRTDKDFIAYVTTSVFSVAQNMSKDDFIVISRGLLEDTETFRTLLMLAFSAQMPRPQKTESAKD